MSLAKLKEMVNNFNDPYKDGHAVSRNEVGALLDKIMLELHRITKLDQEPVEEYTDYKINVIAEKEYCLEVQTTSPERAREYAEELFKGASNKQRDIWATDTGEPVLIDKDDWLVRT